MASLKICNLTASEREEIRFAVSQARHYWPNAHLGDVSPREDIRSAFKMIRSRILTGATVYQACGAVLNDALAHADM